LERRDRLIKTQEPISQVSAIFSSTRFPYFKVPKLDLSTSTTDLSTTAVVLFDLPKIAIKPYRPIIGLVSHKLQYQSGLRAIEQKLYSEQLYNSDIEKKTEKETQYTIRPPIDIAHISADAWVISVKKQNHHVFSTSLAKLDRHLEAQRPLSASDNLPNWNQTADIVLNEIDYESDEDLVIVSL